MELWQRRVVAERNGIAERKASLEGFMHTDEYAALTSVNQWLMMVQQVAMGNYLDVLSRRIELF